MLTMTFLKTSKKKAYITVKLKKLKTTIMETKNEYSIIIAGINCGWTNYQLWRNGQDIDPDDLTIDEMKLFEKELLEFSETFKEQIKYLEKL